MKDNGIGIPENKKNFLFKRFENHLNGDYFTTQSTGIGLSLVKELADLQQSIYCFESRQGQGSTFTVSLKRKDYFDDTVEYILNDGIGDKEEKESATKTENTETTKPKQVLLIVEDDSELRKFLKSLFSSSFKVYELQWKEIGTGPTNNP